MAQRESQLIADALSSGMPVVVLARSGRVLAVIAAAIWSPLGAGAPLDLLLERNGGLGLFGLRTAVCSLLALVHLLELPDPIGSGVVL